MKELNMDYVKINGTKYYYECEVAMCKANFKVELHINIYYFDDDGNVVKVKYERGDNKSYTAEKIVNKIANTINGQRAVYWDSRYKKDFGFRNELKEEKLDIFKAVENSNIEFVKKYIEEGGAVNVKDNSGDTILHIAVDNNNLEMVKFLLENGANANTEDEWSGTPLHYAINDNSIEIVELLLENGADVNIKNELNQTPIHLAIENENTEILKLLLSYCANINKLKEEI